MRQRWGAWGRGGIRNTEAAPQCPADTRLPPVDWLVSSAGLAERRWQRLAKEVAADLWHEVLEHAVCKGRAQGVMRWDYVRLGVRVSVNARLEEKLVIADNSRLG